jgi:hypothetical protein
MACIVGDLIMYVIRLALLACLLLISACTLTTQLPPSPEAIDPPPGETSNRPVVTISNPAEGAQLVTGQQIFVAARAVDTVGVTRVQLIANNQIVKTVSSETSAGNRNFDVLLDYTPRTPGVLNLQVVAYRNALASDPAQVNVTVSAAQPTAAGVPTVSGGNPGGGGNSGPVIDPLDPTCRALTTAGLNVRSGPGTNFDRLTVLGAGVQVPIVGRTAVNDWWQVRTGTITGWVAAVYTQVYGICTAVPIISLATATPVFTFTPPPTFTPRPSATPGIPDLVISSISGSNQVSLASAATQTYAVAITNTGSGPAGQFRVRYTGPSGAENDLGVVASLNAGETIVLNVEVTFTATGSIPISARADTDNQITEVSEVNNNGTLFVRVDP